MDATGRRSAFALPPAVTWSLSVGIYALVCAALLLLATSQVTTLAAGLLALPSDSPLWLAGPVPVIGAVAWWAVVERRGTYTYLHGGAAVLVTALLTVLFWVFRAAFVWDPEGILVGWPLVLAVLVPTIPAALVAGVQVMYARRRLGGERPG